MRISNFDAGIITEKFKRLLGLNENFIKAIKELKKENKFFKMKIKNLEEGVDYQIKENFKLSDKLGLIDYNDPDM